MKKQITLKNNQSVILTCSLDLEGFYISATHQGKQVGMCQFHIFHVFAQKMNAKKKELYSKMHKISLAECPENLEVNVDVLACDNLIEKLFNKKINQGQDFTIKDNTLVFNSGGTYNYNYSTCELLRIEILDEQFSHKGLGYEMLKFMEEIATAFNAERIDAIFIPNGNFFHASMEFYKRNGFTFSQNGSIVKLSKSITDIKKLG